MSYTRYDRPKITTMLNGDLGHRIHALEDIVASFLCDRAVVARCVHCGHLFDTGETFLAHIPCVSVAAGTALPGPASGSRAVPGTTDTQLTPPLIVGHRSSPNPPDRKAEKHHEPATDRPVHRR